MRNYILWLLGFVLLVACDPSKTSSSDSRDPLIGEWTCKEVDELSYQVSVSASPLEEDKMFFNNLYNLKKNVEVIISGNALVIPSQTVDNFNLRGSGSVDNGKKIIDLDFMADDTPVKAKMTKR